MVSIGPGTLIRANQMDIVSLAVIAAGLLLFSFFWPLTGHGYCRTAPLANAWARLTERMGECAENMPAVEIPLREGHIENRTQE